MPRTAKPPTYGPEQVLKQIHLSAWQVAAAQRAGLIRPGGARWTQDEVDDVLTRRDDILATVGTVGPMGASRAALRLAEATGLEVVRADVATLIAEAGLIPVDEYKGWPMYAAPDIDALDTGRLAVIVAERTGWEAVSLVRREAAEFLGLSFHELDQVADRRDIPRGPAGRYPLADLRAARADATLLEEVTGERRWGTAASAGWLDITLRDFKYCVAAGWISPVDHTMEQVSRNKYVEGPLYRLADLRTLKARRDVPWEEVRAVAPGRPSRLREFVHLPVARAKVVHAFCDRLADEHGVEVFRHYDSLAERWEIFWMRNEASEPTHTQVRAAVAGHKILAGLHAERTVVLGSLVGQTIRWARRMLEPGVAVVLDFETTSLEGQVVEVAVRDAHNGELLLDTLVRAAEPVSAGAHAIHGITEADLAGAPTWEQVLPRILAASKGRVVVTYNAPFDRGRLWSECRRTGTDPAHLGDPDAWKCLMEARSIWARTRYSLPLLGPHRAAGDTAAAHELLHRMVTPPGHRPRTDPGRR